MTGPLFEMDRVSKHYAGEGDDVRALRSVSFSVNDAESLAIIGPSGSGKSTLLHLMGGLVSPSEGELRYRGENIFAYSSKRRAAWRNAELGFVFQFHHLLGEFSALENVMMPLMIAGVSRKEAMARAEVLFEAMQLKHRMTHLPSALSGGERQRVAIARALVNNPKVLLADEPTGSLDHEQGAYILDYLLQEHQHRNMTLVIVTHNQELSARLDRVIAIRDGCVDRI